MRRPRSGLAASHDPTAKTVISADFASASRSSASASDGSPLPWKVSATCGLLREPVTTSVAGAPGAAVSAGAALVGVAADGGADDLAGGAAEPACDGCLLPEAAAPQPVSAIK